MSALRHRGVLPPLLLLAFAATAHAQSRGDSLAIANRELFHRSDLLVAAGFAAATAAMFPLDRQLATELRTDAPRSRNLERTSLVFRVLGGEAPAILGASAYIAGRATHRPVMAEIGLHTTEALLVATGVSSLIKVAAGRERPYVSADTNPHRFRPFRGWRSSDVMSFPSGHTTAAFSMAAALTAEVNERWPHRTRFVAPALFTLAAGAGLSRMYDDKHWASDVVMGAAIGTFAGLKTVRFNHTHAGNRLDRALLGEFRLAWRPLPGGFTVTVSNAP